MKKVIFFVLIIALFFIFTDNIKAEDNFAYQHEASAQNQFKKEAGFTGSLRVDNFSGAANYNLGLEVPPGRNGIQPSLNLYYNSHDKSPGSWVGQGWSLDLGYVTRTTKEGSNNLYESNEFTLFLNNKSYDLVNLGGNTYGSKAEGDYLKIATSTDSWIVTDTMGTKYYFGQTAAARQDDPSDSTRIYKWMLDRVEDTNDNYYRVTYYKLYGQIYPDDIYYTGHDTTDGPMQISFNLE
ncbi:hypothetical protein HOE31_04095 [bacterium]|nr:hypothetical protein [bacterium]MBT4122100.1 hypothetical protein [bacterium]MBT4335378.1 hypothetical protein [bacterium]MBT4495497.1 hypothetical protein [bacterium]MBT4764309.1 hypothetical protein [bacterium]